MMMNLIKIIVNTRLQRISIDLDNIVTFLYGPIGKGKSTVARLIDYCLGGDLERTPAIQKEFISVEISLKLSENICEIERSTEDTQSVRFTWTNVNEVTESLNVPLVAGENPILNEDVYNLSDLIFYLAGIIPIKVLKNNRDPNSQLIRLSIRDIWHFCYLDQTHLDSSFFKFEDTFRGRKSQDAMRFFTGLYSEKLSQLQIELMKIVDDQRTKRESVVQIRTFMSRFELDTELDIIGQITEIDENIIKLEADRSVLEKNRSVELHPTDLLRERLRSLSLEINDLSNSIFENITLIQEQKSLRSEFIITKIKSQRIDAASTILEGVKYKQCPQCGEEINAPDNDRLCSLCGKEQPVNASFRNQEVQELFRRDINERIDQIAESISRREREIKRMERKIEKLKSEKGLLDKQLQNDLARYDSAFIETIRESDRKIATLRERKISIQKFLELSRAIVTLEEEAGSLQGKIDSLKSAVSEEKKQLKDADTILSEIAAEFKRIILAVSFPGVSKDDQVILDPRNWNPTIVHKDQQWGYWDTGSGGKKTLFNVCFALALHNIGISRSLPIPNILIIDSPTKNISEDENPELIELLYKEIYKIADQYKDSKFQLILIDSDIYRPTDNKFTFSERHMAGSENSPSLIPYYVGP